MTRDIHIAYKQVDAGYCQNTGAKLDMIGQIYGFENYNAIGVLRAITANQKAELVFLELNGTNDDVNQITNEQRKEALENIWFDAQVGAIFSNVMANGGIDGLMRRVKGERCN